MDYPKNVVVPDKASFERKLATLKKGGAGSLHVITDFDRTLTKCFMNGMRFSLSYDPLYECFKDPVQRKKVDDLADYYLPIENDPHLPLPEKTEHMRLWWNKYFKIAAECRILQSNLFSECEKYSSYFRLGVPDFFSLLDKKVIPVLIFSAGIQNVMECYLKKAGIVGRNMHMISNILKFDESGVMVGYSEPLIHIFNKDERHLKDAGFRQIAAKRKNVILLGDSLGDLKMADGVVHDTVLKIGFLNSDVEANMNAYSEGYDALILNDGTFEFVDDVLKEIL